MPSNQDWFQYIAFLILLGILALALWGYGPS